MAPKPKMVQMKLSFAPVATFPDSRRDGAAIVPGPAEQPGEEPAMGPPAPPAKKPRRDLLSMSVNPPRSKILPPPIFGPKMAKKSKRLSV